MKIPIEWLTEYINTDKSVKQIADDFTVLGLMLDKPIESYQDNTYRTEILDLEHRMDRADWLSILGCARDLSAFYDTPLKLPPTNDRKGLVLDGKDVINVKVECPDIVHRFNTKVFKNITVKSSPDWLKNRLQAYGIPSINNIVDITNYVMVEYGQPMHAQDLAKMEKREIVIRRAKNNEKIITLLGEELTLTSDQFVLAQNQTATVVGGIVGGQTTAVDENTKEIILDAGNYNQTNIRKSSRYLKIQNETVLRYDKFLHPILAEKAINRAIFLIEELAGGDYYENVDWYPTKFPQKNITLTHKRTNLISGMIFKPSTIEKILTKLGYEITSYENDVWQVQVPYFRTDVEVEDDLIADLLRISNYNTIPFTPINLAPPTDITPKMYLFKDRIRDLLVSMGAHEHISDPIIESKDGKQQIILKNALSSEKNALRTELAQSLLAIIELYEKHHEKKIFIFEIGNIYLQKSSSEKYSDFVEKETLCVIFKNNDGNSYQNLSDIKGILLAIFQGLGIDEYKISQTDDNGADILIGQDIAGNITTNMINLSVATLIKFEKSNSRLISEFKQTTVENISLVMDKDLKFGQVLHKIKNFDKNIEKVLVLEEYHGKELNGKKTILCEIHYSTNNTSKIRQNLFELLQKEYKITHRQ